RAKHRLGPGQLGVEDLSRDVEELADQHVAHRVADRGPLFAGGDHVLGAQDSQLLRHGRLVELEAGLELLHAALAGPEDLEDPDTDGVRQRLEELRLEGREIGGRRRRAHENSYIKVVLYSQVLTRDQRAVEVRGP